MPCQRDTLIKYLLDELYTYEGDHSDALNPFESPDSVARQTGEQGEVDRMCSLELRSRLEELQMQNERNQRRMEERYKTYLVQQQVQLASYRYHPYYPQALTGPGVVSILLVKLPHHDLTDLGLIY